MASPNVDAIKSMYKEGLEVGFEHFRRLARRLGIPADKCVVFHSRKVGGDCISEWTTVTPVDASLVHLHGDATVHGTNPQRPRLP